MEEFKGTKGDWKTEEYHYGELIGVKVISIIEDEENEESVIYDSDLCGYISDETEANAKLIAAAPEMLEMLKELHIKGYDFDNWDNVEKLLNKILE